VAFAEVFGGIFIDAIKQVTNSTKNLGEGFDAFVVFIGEAAARFIEVLARMVEATAQWAADISKRVIQETKDFLDLAPSIIAVGRALDFAIGGGTHQSGFDALSKNLESLRKALPSIESGAKTAGDAIRSIATGVADAAKGAGATFGATYARIQREITASADEMRKSLKAVGDGGIEGAEKAGGAFKAFEKQLSELTAQINRAKANGTPIAELVKLFGEEAAKATPKARAWGIAVSASVDEVSRAFNALEKQKVFDKLDDGLQKFARTLEQKQFKKLQDDFHKATEAGLKLKETFDKLEDGLQKFGDQLAKKQFGRLSEGMHDSVDDVIAKLHPIHDAFEELGKQLPDLLFSALKSGEVSAILLAPAAAIGKAFGDVFQKALEASIKAGTKLSTTQKVIGLIGGAAEAFVSSFAIGQGVGSPGKGALAGAGAGAAAGLPLAAATGGLSIAIGAGIGALGGLFGGRSAEKKAKESLEQNKIALAQQFGGMEKLRALAEKLGVNIAAAFDAKKPAQFQAAVDKLNAAIEAQNKRIEGLNTALAAVNTRAKLFADQFSGLVETRKGGGDEGAIAAQKIQELAQRTQPEFERLGVFVRDTFAGLVKESGNAFQALTDLAPAFQTLKSGISDFGLTSTAVIDALVSNFDLVNNEAFKPFFENIQASGQLFKGLFDAKALSPEGFQAVAADIGQSIQSIVDRGGDMAKTLALSQPVLQGLWEAQQTFGNITDQTTQSILNQAEQQGIVGAQFKSTQDKVLAVLLAIADVFGAKIPEGIRATASAAETAGKTIESSLVGASDRSAANIETKVGRSLAGLSGKARTAASDIERELSGIDVAPIAIRLDLDTSAFDRIPDDIRINTSIDVPAFATGGIVRKRTLAIIGEAGPEAVVPLSKIESVAKPQQRTTAPRVSFGDVVINGPVDNRERAQQVVKDFARAVREGGASRTLALRTLGLEKV
jgi:predicted  nucleic acid-binding Zn-ribbon protein